MSSGQRVGLAALGLVGLLLIIAGVLSGWPGAIQLVLIVSVMAVLVVIGLRSLDSASVPVVPSAPIPVVAPPPPQVQQANVESARLPSALADFEFLFTATVRWLGFNSRHGNPAGVAVELILSRAREVAAAQPPELCGLAQAQLGSLLGQPTRDPAGHVEAWASEVRLTLPEKDEKRLRDMADVRKEVQVWEHRREWERSKRAYLSDDVLKSPGSAMVWWLSRKDEEIEGTVNLIGHFARLSATARDTEVPAALRHLDPIAPAAPSMPFGTADGGGVRLAEPSPRHPESPADHVVALIDALGYGGPGKESERALLGERFARVIENADRADIAETVRERFGNSSEPGDLTLDMSEDSESAEPGTTSPEHSSPIAETLFRPDWFRTDLDARPIGSDGDL